MENAPKIAQRKIIHIDMDAFFASVEQRDNPAYRGYPIVVGGSPEGRGGVVAAASYEARKFGVRSAMPSKTALQLCPSLIFVTPRFAVYKEVSAAMRAILNRHTDLIEPLSLDEAYLDVTYDKLQIGSAIAIAQQIRKAIRDELQLTASAGVSVNKFIAKTASGMNKPDGLTFIGPGEVHQFMETLPVDQFFGVGKVTAARMQQLGLRTGADVKALSLDELTRHFGKAGNFFYKVVRGIDDRQVVPFRAAKSIGAEDTFSHDLTTLAEMNEALERIGATVHRRLQNAGLYGRTLTLKVKFHNFKQITRNKSMPTPISNYDEIVGIAQSMTAEAIVAGSRVRLLGISISNFSDGSGNSNSGKSYVQLQLF